MMKKLVIARRISQSFFLLLFFYILWSTTYPLRGAIPPKTFFVIDPLIAGSLALSERIVLSGIIYSAVMVCLTLLLGRFFCGWICPLGAIIDGIGTLRKKHHAVSDTVNTKLRIPKFFILAVIVLLSIFGIQAAWIFDPIVTMTRFTSTTLLKISSSHRHSVSRIVSI